MKKNTYSEKILWVALVLPLSLPFLYPQSQKFSEWPTPTCGIKCGEDRWIAKAPADMDAGKVDFFPEEATFDGLRKLKRPGDLPIDGRAEPMELKTFTLKAVLLQYKKEDDHDFHLVIADPQDKKKTIIAEITDPGCRRVCQSEQIQKLKAVRAKFIEKFEEPGSEFKKLDPPVPIVITGVGFFDFRHGQTGRAPNAFECIQCLISNLRTRAVVNLH